MKSLVLVLALTATPALAQEPAQPVERPGILPAFAAAVLVVPAALYVLGEAWEAACTGSGFTYAVDPADNLWKCTAAAE